MRHENQDRVLFDERQLDDQHEKYKSTGSSSGSIDGEFPALVPNDKLSCTDSADEEPSLVKIDRSIIKSIFLFILFIRNRNYSLPLDTKEIELIKVTMDFEVLFPMIIGKIPGIFPSS